MNTKVKIIKEVRTKSTISNKLVYGFVQMFIHYTMPSIVLSLKIAQVESKFSGVFHWAILTFQI